MKVNSKPCQTAEKRVFPLLTFRGESYHTSKMEFFAKIVKTEKSLTIFARTSIFDVWQGSEYASELVSKLKNVSFLNQFKYQR